MFQAWIISGVLLFAADAAFGETCQGPADDGSAFFDVEVTKGDDEKPTFMSLYADGSPLAEYADFDDLTPKGPTDELYRYVFHDGSPARGEIAVMLMEGGFTLHLTAQIWRLSPDASSPETLATLNCR